MTHDQAVATLATERYLLGEMSAEARDDFEAHYFSCARCAADVRAGALLQDAVRARLGAPTAAAGRIVPFRSSRLVRSLAPWAVAATFALVAGYEALAPGVRPGANAIGAAPIALTPTTIRPASRGREAVAAPGAGGLITLAIDVGPLGDAGELVYTIDDVGGGRQVAAGRVPAPPDGAPLLLVVRTEIFEPAAHYRLTVKNPRNADLTAGDYRFTVGAR